MKKPISLQRQLLKTSMWSSIAAGSIAFFLLCAVATYQTMNIQDELMDEIADILLLDDIRQSGHLDQLTEEFEIRYALKIQEQVFVQSEHPPIEWSNLHDGFQFGWKNQQIWRIYHVQEQHLQAIIMQPLIVRFQSVLHFISGYIAVLCGVWLLQWGFLYIALARQFRVVRELSAQISKKNAHDLHAIEMTHPEIIELQPIVLQLNQLLSRLEHTLIAEQRFTADASHELRSPLSAMQMRLQVLQRKYQHLPDLAENLAPIQHDLKRGTQILENLLMLARLDPTQANEIKKQKINLAHMFDEVQHSLAPFINEKNIDIMILGHDISIQAHTELLFSCLRNLVDNAVRYGEIGGKVWIHLNEQNLIIEDNGLQVNAEVISRLGERFYRALGTQQQGSGLGVSICKKIVELHQWKIFFQQSSHGGLKVIIQF